MKTTYTDGSTVDDSVSFDNIPSGAVFYYGTSRSVGKALGLKTTDHRAVDLENGYVWDKRAFPDLKFWLVDADLRWSFKK